MVCKIRSNSSPFCKLSYFSEVLQTKYIDFHWISMHSAFCVLQIVIFFWSFAKLCVFRRCYKFLTFTWSGGDRTWYRVAHEVSLRETSFAIGLFCFFVGFLVSWKIWNNHHLANYHIFLKFCKKTQWVSIRFWLQISIFLISFAKLCVSPWFCKSLSFTWFLHTPKHFPNPRATGSRTRSTNAPRKRFPAEGCQSPSDEFWSLIFPWIFFNNPWISAAESEAMEYPAAMLVSKMDG